MKNIWGMAIWVMATIAGLAAVPTVAMAENDSSTLTNENLKPTGHRAFRGGESLNFIVKYGFVKGGESKFVVRDTVVNGRNVEHITVSGRTTGIADVIYEVRDTYESFMDKETQLPLISYRNVHEGRYRYYDRTTYDNKNCSVSIHKETRKGEKDTTENVCCNIMDVVSAFYYARNNNFNNSMNLGDTICYQTFFGGKPFPLSIRYKGLEHIKTKWGKVLCYKFSPVTEVGRTFKGKDDMFIWITADDNRLPIKIEFKMIVGSFTFELTSCTGLAHVANYGD